MQNYGFDDGEKSVGVAVVDDTNKKIYAAVSIFNAGVDPSKGNSLNEDRRLNRSTRRNIDSNSKRIKELLDFLGQHRDLDLGDHSFILYKRALSATQVLDNFDDFVRVLRSICKTRGPSFPIQALSTDGNSKELGEQKTGILELSKLPGKTVGEKLLYFYERNGRYRNRNNNYSVIAHRDMIKQELEVILTVQSQNPEWGYILTEKNIQKIIDIIISQKPCTWDRDVLARDSIEPSQHRAYKNSLLAQEFLVLKEITDTRINGKKLSEEQANLLKLNLDNIYNVPTKEDFLKFLELDLKSEIEGKIEYNNLKNIQINGQFLSEDNCRKLVKLFFKGRSHISSREVRKILSLAPTDRLTKSGAQEKFICNSFLHKFVVILASNGYKIEELFETFLIKLDDKLNKLVRSGGNPKSIEKFKKYFGKYLDENTIDEILSIEFGTDRISYSAKSLRNILPYMERGCCEHEALERYASDSGNRNYLNELSLNKNQRQTIKKGEKHGVFSMPSSPYTNSPRARRSLFVVRDMINHFVNYCGKPDFIYVECTRELKSTQKNISKYNSKTENLKVINERIKKFLAEKNIKFSKKILDRIKLWIQQDGKCLYSLDDISLEDVVAGINVEIDHIIPQSWGWDNISNTVLVYKKLNMAKRDRLPYEFLSPDKFKEMVKYCEELAKRKKDLKKYRNNLFGVIPMDEQKIKKLKLEEIPDGFNDGQITSLAHTEASIINWLKPTFFPKENHKVVFVVPQLVAELRKRWGFPQKSRNDHREHALDAILIACLNPKTRNQLIDILKKEKATGIYENAGPELPWDGFVDDVNSLMGKIVVYHTPNRKQSFPLHEKNPIGVPKKDIFRSNVDGFFCKKDDVKTLKLDVFYLPENFEENYLRLSTMNKREKKEFIAKMSSEKDSGGKTGMLRVIKDRFLCYKIRKFLESRNPEFIECFKHCREKGNALYVKKFADLMRSFKEKIIIDNHEVIRVKTIEKKQDDCVVKISPSRIYKSGLNYFALIFSDSDNNIHYVVKNNFDTAAIIRDIKKEQKRRVEFRDICNYVVKDGKKIILGLRRGSMLIDKKGNVFVVKKISQATVDICPHYLCENKSVDKKSSNAVIAYKKLAATYRPFYPKRVYEV